MTMVLALTLLVMLAGVLTVGGTATVFRAPYPKGEDGYVLFSFGGISLTGVTGAQTIAGMTIPFGCKPVYAELVAGGAITDADADGTLKIIDDTGTPKEFVTATVVTALGAGAAKVFNVNETVEFYAGALMTVVWTPGDAGDALVNATVNIWVKPTH